VSEPVAAHREAAPYYFLFDYLRFVLAAGVLAFHADQHGVLPKYLGDLCVKVFFALSGFLIGGILLRTRPRDLPRFYFNRVTRIWIPYAIAIALLFTATVLYRQPLTLRTGEFFFYKISFVYNLFGPPQLERLRALMPLSGTGNHFWSICLEEQFYLLAPLILIFLRQLRVPFLIAIWIGGTVFRSTSVDFSPVALGVLLAISKERFGTWYLRTPWMIGLLALCLVSAAGVISDLPSYDVSAAVFAVCLVALLARNGTQLPFGAWAGGLSYPLYLNHWIGLVARKGITLILGFGTAATNITGAIIAIGLALFHFALVDRNVLRARASWYTPRRGAICCAFAYGLLIIGVVGGFLIARIRAY
jgi:peptidoglycan/LPS O-acetylase OafA/YrhL